MIRFAQGFMVILLLVVAYYCSQLRVEPAVQLSRPETVVKQVLPEKKIQVQIADVKWPTEPEAKLKRRPVKPKPKPKKQPVVARESNPDSATAVKSGKGGDQNANGLDVVGQFDCPVEFYLDAMRRQGARVVVYEGNRKQFYSLTQNLSLSALDGFPAGYSQVTRRITDDYPNARSVIRSAEARWGYGYYDILIIVPQSLELRLAQEMRRLIAASLPPERVSQVSVRYQQSGRDLVMYVEHARAGGSTIAIDRAMTL